MPTTHTQPRKPSKWLTLAVRGISSWPEYEYVQHYDGFDFLLLPETETAPTAIAIEVLPPLDYNSARAAVRRFLSAFTWVHGCAADDDFGIGSAYPGGVGKNEGPVRCSDRLFHIDYLPSTTDPKTRLCLALYREALGLTNHAYRFLGFYKLVNVLSQNWKKQVAWINAAIPKLSEPDAVARITELRKTESDLGHYLYVSGRCAVAHAFNDPVVDPDDPTDTQRLHADLPIAKALAELFIEVEHGIKSADTVWREHLYELRGFREFFGADTVQRLKAKENVDPAKLLTLPIVSIHVRYQAPYLALQQMTGTVTGIKNGVVDVQYTSSTQRVRIRMQLDFPEERLRFDLFGSIEMTDDGSTDAAQEALDLHRLFRDVFKNGVVELWTDGSDQAFAQTQPYMPINMRYNSVAWQSSLEAKARTLLIRSGAKPRQTEAFPRE